MSLATDIGMDTNSLEFLNFCRELHDIKKKSRRDIRQFIESQPEARRERIRAYFNEWDKKRRRG